MNAAEITALCVGIPAIVTAVTALVKVLQHASNPQAHQPKP